MDVYWDRDLQSLSVCVRYTTGKSLHAWMFTGIEIYKAFQCVYVIPPVSLHAWVFTGIEFYKAFQCVYVIPPVSPYTRGCLLG